jgi:hypothetical protein
MSRRNRSKRRRTVTAKVHAYQPDGSLGVDVMGEGCCASCGLPKGSRVHEVPDASEAAAEGARRIGEGTGDG